MIVDIPSSYALPLAQVPLSPRVNHRLSTVFCRISPQTRSGYGEYRDLLLKRLWPKFRKPQEKLCWFTRWYEAGAILVPVATVLPNLVEGSCCGRTHCGLVCNFCPPVGDFLLWPERDSGCGV